MDKSFNNRKPNCIFIAADQLRYDVLGRGFTPNIDRLMNESVSFKRAYCASPLCVPARGALFTGTYPGVNGSLINGWYEPERKYSKVKTGIDNLYDIMEKLEMECIHSGKQHLFTEGELLENRKDTKTKWLTTEKTYRDFLNSQGKRAPGGTRFRTPVPEMNGESKTRICTYSNPETGIYGEGEGCYFDEYFTREALKELERFNGEKPLFLSMMYLAPHPPLEIPEPWYSRINPEQVTLPENVGIWYENQSPLQKYNVTGMVGNSYRREDWKEPWRVYLGLVGMLDHCVGRILDKLKRKGLYEDSIIIFTSDHGEMLGSHCLFQKMCMYEESVRTPLSIRLPGGQWGGKNIEDYVSHVDILPTILDFYGVAASHEMNGRSLMDLIAKGGGQRETPVFIQYDGNASRGNFQRCIIWKNHKLIVDIFKDETYFELYDLENDVQETRNILADRENLKLAAAMNALLKKHMNDMKDMVTYESGWLMDSTDAKRRQSCLL